MSKIVLSGMDYDHERTSVNIPYGTVGGDTKTGMIADATNVLALINAVVTLQYGVSSINLVDVPDTPDNAVDAFSQRETKWRVVYTDDVNPVGNGSFEIGGADLTKLSPGTGRADLADADIAALVAWLEANSLSRLGNAISIEYIEHVGRNL